MMNANSSSFDDAFREYARIVAEAQRTIAQTAETLQPAIERMLAVVQRDIVPALVQLEQVSAEIGRSVEPAMQAIGESASGWAGLSNAELLTFMARLAQNDVADVASRELAYLPASSETEADSLPLSSPTPQEITQLGRALNAIFATIDETAASHPYVVLTITALVVARVLGDWNGAIWLLVGLWGQKMLDADGDGGAHLPQG